MDSEHEVNNMQGRVGGEGDDVLVEGMQVDDYNSIISLYLK